MTKALQYTIEREVKTVDPAVPMYQIIDNNSGKSSIWKKFGIVATAAGETQDFAACKSCKAAYVFKTGANAAVTKTINKHVCNDPSPAASAANVFFKKSTVTKSQKPKMTAASAQSTCAHLKP
jgi:hypothetical protein